jgi:integrase
MLTMRRTKFAKSRQIPVHPSTTNALKRYRALRNHHVEITDQTLFFVGTRGRHRGVD